LKEAMASMPRLARQAGGCPCGKSVRWVVEANGGTGGGEPLNP